MVSELGLVVTTKSSTIYEAGGLRFGCRFALEELPEAEGATSFDLSVSLAGFGQVVQTFSGPADPPAIELTPLEDGCSYWTEQGRDGDRLISYWDRAVFHLSSDGRTLQCAPVDFEDPAWRHFLLDTVLGMASSVIRDRPSPQV